MRGVFDKKASVDVTLPVVIFLLLNIMFAVTVLAFVNKTLSGAAIYEEVYAKKVALLIDEAIPNTTIYLNVSKAVEIAKKNGFNQLQLQNEIFTFDRKSNGVIVKLSNRWGYEYSYFTDYSLSEPRVNIDDKGNNILSFEVKNA